MSLLRVALPLLFLGLAPLLANPGGHPDVLRAGRFDLTDPNAPVVIWQASRIAFDFTGDSLELLFSDAKGQNYFDVSIDGARSLTEIREGTAPKNARFTGLGPGTHRAELFKRSEAAAGHVRFRGIALATDGKLLPARPLPDQLRLQFFGDSITAGACNEDGETDQWEDRSTHNAAHSYAAMIAAAFDADHRNIAVSGMGISIGWVEPRAGQIWDRVYPKIGSPRADLSDWQPHVVFVNFGENDNSYPEANGLPFPPDFASNYVALVRSMREAFPTAQFVILRGGMAGGAKSEPLRAAWEQAVAELEAGDPRITHFVFQHWSRQHPRVADDRAMADELIAWLREQPFLREHATTSAR